MLLLIQHSNHVLITKTSRAILKWLCQDLPPFRRGRHHRVTAPVCESGDLPEFERKPNKGIKKEYGRILATSRYFMFRYAVTKQPGEGIEEAQK